MREAAGRTIEDAALALECSMSKISRLEMGKGVPFPRDVRDLLALYGTQGRSAELLDLVTEGRAQDWFSNFRDVFQGEMTADHLHRFFELERNASVIKVFEADLIPGLLQTEEYIDAVCSIVFPERTQKERARFVEFRRARQEVLLTAGDDRELNFIVSELGVVRRIGGPGVIRRQLAALHADLSGRLRVVDFRLTPLVAEARGALGGPFAVLKYSDPADQDVVYLEGREGATYLESDGDVARYEQLFSSLERDSLTREESIERLSEEIGRLS
jgi:Domain of unknown function (DUF5753)/Helix-turn-helix domain